MKIKVSILFLVIAAVFVFFVFKGGYFSTQKPTAPVAAVANEPLTNEKIIETLSVMDLRDYEGKKIVLDKAALVSHQKLVIHMWASWCGPCVGEVPELIKYSKKNPDVKFIIISMDDFTDEISKFMKSFPAFNSKEFYRVWDFDKQLTKLFSVDRLPMSVLINSTQSEPKFMKSIVRWDSVTF